MVKEMINKFSFRKLSLKQSKCLSDWLQMGKGMLFLSSLTNLSSFPDFLMHHLKFLNAQSDPYVFKDCNPHQNYAFPLSTHRYKEFVC